MRNGFKFLCEVHRTIFFKSQVDPSRREATRTFPRKKHYITSLEILAAKRFVDHEHLLPVSGRKMEGLRTELWRNGPQPGALYNFPGGSVSCPPEPVKRTL